MEATKLEPNNDFLGAVAYVETTPTTVKEIAEVKANKFSPLLEIEGRIEGLMDLDRWHQPWTQRSGAL